MSKQINESIMNKNKYLKITIIYVLKIIFIDNIGLSLLKYNLSVVLIYNG